MNPMIGALQKRVLHLTETVAIQKFTFDRLLSDLEMTESMGCAFAWDLQLSLEHGYALSSDFRPSEVMSDIEDYARSEWDAAMQAGAAFQEAKKWLREKMRTDKVWRKTAIEAAGKNPDMDIETPHGYYSLRLLTAT